MVVRLAMAAFGVVYGWWGVWAVLFPRHFFDTFPGIGRQWTAAYPPYNEHLITDVGATFLTLAFLLLAGAATRNRGVRAVALLAVALFGALHLAFHIGHHGELGSADLVTSLVALGLGVLVPLGLLIADRRLGQRRAEGPS